MLAEDPPSEAHTRIWLAERDGHDKLDLYGLGLRALPPEIGKLTDLTQLNVGENRLSSLPPEIWKLTRLTTLHLGANRFSQLPAEIGELTNLRDLSVYENSLSSLPPEIGKLSELCTLRASDNELRSLPAEIGELTNLTDLYVNENQLSSLAPEIGKLTHLTDLYVTGNPLTDPPPEVVEQGTEAILVYLRERLKASQRQWVSKLLIIGEGGVGKTCLLDVLQGRRFDPHSETTHGIRVEPLSLAHPSEEGVAMTLNAWDFGGQQIYHATHQFFLSAGALFLVAWNARQGWEAGKLKPWLDRIHALAPKEPVLLVATHTDERLADLPYETLRKDYPQIVGHFSVSSKDGTGVDELRQKLSLAAAGLARMGQDWPADWLVAAGAIRARKGDNYIPADELRRIMGEHGVSAESREVLAKTLHELGDILYFADDAELRDIALLDPEWVTHQVSAVLECAGVKKGLGIFRREHMADVWANLDSTTCDRLLRLMERFDLSYRIPGDPENKSLVVERLSQDPVDYEERWNAILETQGCKELTMTFDLGIRRPAGIPTWFIARSHRFTLDTHWLYGALLGDDRQSPRHLALVLAPPTEEQIVMLTVRGPSPQNFFALLRDGLQLTFARFPGLAIRRTIRCPGHSGRPCRHSFDYEYVRRAIEREPPIGHIQCPRTFENVSVTDLLFGLHPATDEYVIGRLEELSEQLRNAPDDQQQYRPQFGHDSES